ncbi:MAG: DsrH/TusB family sulfur metabolism protein [Rheinheimera sp.]|nr:DsrH/TusB family sulfur metabolism protein [Rheinheimera sp.]
MRLFQLTQPTVPALLSLAGAEDCVLLRQDAVYLLLQPQHWPCRLCVLENDLQARSLVCPAEVQSLSDSQWVALTLQAKQIILCQN